MRTWIATTSRGPGVGSPGPEAGASRFTLYVLRNPQYVTRSKPEASNLGGFTLLELSLTLFIIGLLVTVLLPRFGDIGGARLENSARRLAALARYVNGEAAFHGQVYRIRYDLGEQSYAVQVLMPSRGVTEFVADSSPMSQPVRLPAGVIFAGISVSQAGRMNTGQVFTHFYPHGYVDPTVVHLQDHRARMMTVVIPPLTGEARVYEGYVDGTSH